ncbi:MAG TPA: hypothetical protein PKA41_13450 [Verrucomicrobiota bacterium]|nr:hypothetical protein [Verrucomicrobiota bacterium]
MNDTGKAQQRIASVRGRLCGMFCPEEVDRDPRLKIICGCLLLYFHMTFHYWRQRSVPLSTLGNEVFNYVPSPFIENFRWVVFMNNFQTEVYLYLLGMVALFGLFSLFWFRSSLIALCALAFLFLNKVYFYLADVRLLANYHHFHLFFTLVFLISTDKLRCFRLALGLGYILSGVVKLTPSWLFGEYFNSLPNKLPLLPKVDWVVTAACVGVVLLEFLGPLCWLTGIRWLRRLSFGAFVLFHVYSGWLVGFWYTTLMLPLVVAAFMGFDEPLLKGFKFTRRQLGVAVVFAVACVGGVYHLFIPGDARLTSEGRYLGLFMFDANRKVQFEVEIQKGHKNWALVVYRGWSDDTEGMFEDSGIQCEYYEDGWLSNRFEVVRSIYDGDEVIFNPQYFKSARMRVCGDPYLYYHYARELVGRYNPDRVSMRLFMQLDGHPETVALINIEDFERLDPRYTSLGRNDWILLPGPESPAQYRWP